MRSGMSAVLLVAGLGLVALPARAALVVSTDATVNVSCKQGQFARVCTATANDAVLNVNKLTNMLASQNVNVATGNATNDIIVNAALSWASASGLALIAQQSIVVNAHVSDAGTGTELSLQTGTGGHLSFGPHGNINFWDTSSLLVINNQGYQLVNSIASLRTWVGNNPAGYFALAANYDATPDGTYAYAPIQSTLTGTFEGLGNTISRLSINDTLAGDFAALFGILQGGTIENVRLTQVNIHGQGDTSTSALVGGLVGRNEGTLFGDTVTGRATASHALVGGLAGGQDNATVSDSSAAVTVKLTGGGSAGGLLGYSFNGSSVSNSHATGKVTGGANAEVGGLIGENSEPVDNSYATGAISTGANGHAGGLVGSHDGSTISKSYATGSVSAGASANGLRATAGGLVGETCQYCTITHSWAAGAVTAGVSAYGGGLVGDNLAAIDNSYASGSVTSGGIAGGLTAYNGNTISASYSTGAPQGTSGETGGLVGSDFAPPGSVKHTYWDTTTSGITDPSRGSGYPANDPGITPRTTHQLTLGLPKGFSSSIWGEKSTVNNGLPYLLAVPPG